VLLKVVAHRQEANAGLQHLDRDDAGGQGVACELPVAFATGDALGQYEVLRFKTPCDGLARALRHPSTSRSY
jgi:hypothetical protein